MTQHMFTNGTAATKATGEREQSFKPSACRSGTQRCNSLLRSYSEITLLSWSMAFYSSSEWALQLTDSQKGSECSHMRGTHL